MAKKGSIFLNLLGLPPRKIAQIKESWPDPDELFTLSARQLRVCPGLSSGDIETIYRLRSGSLLTKELDLIKHSGVSCLDGFDPDYPELLRQIAHPPVVLYVQGDIQMLKGFIFAIVGSRTPTGYGIRQAQKFAEKLADLGMIIASGLARGIDTAAHRRAVKSGLSIAVLGSGLLRIYPPENHALAKHISQAGAVISEFPLNTAPLRENFPRRNRLISGLSRGVLVVEAAERSGALITARFACEQNREVFAVPGASDSALSRGTNQLIQQGAKLSSRIEDILEEFPLWPKQLTAIGVGNE